MSDPGGRSVEVRLRMEADLELGQIVILGRHFKGEALHHGLFDLAYIAQRVLLCGRNGLLVL